MPPTTEGGTACGVQSSPSGVHGSGPEVLLLHFNVGLLLVSRITDDRFGFLGLRLVCVLFHSQGSNDFDRTKVLGCN